MIKALVRVFEDYYFSYTKNSWHRFIFDEQKKILERIIYLDKLPRDIAPNSAFLENILTCFVCIFSKTPLFICGKPGSSKTIALQILKSAFEGQETLRKSIAFFNHFPSLFVFKIQGSALSTWEQVLETIESAQRATRSYQMGLVFFDEVGLVTDPRVFAGIEAVFNSEEGILARASAQGHSNRRPVVQNFAFVGISNTSLSSAHLNKMVFLARFDPDPEDLVVTAKQILFMNSNKSISENIQKQLSVLAEAIGLGYSKFKRIMSVFAF